MTTPISVFTIENSGKGRGLPIKAVMIVQSNVIGSCQGFKVSCGPTHDRAFGGGWGLFYDSTYKTEAGIIAKDLVENHVVGRDPADPVEIGEALGNPTREPVPRKTPGKNI